MTTLTTRAVPTGRLRTLGPVTVVASLIGAACAVAIIAWRPQVSDDWYSYPFDATGYSVAQSVFAVHLKGTTWRIGHSPGDPVAAG
jgi:hypothetical protein